MMGYSFRKWEAETLSFLVAKGLNESFFAKVDRERSLPDNLIVIHRKINPSL
jgi:hypothetical protein